MQIIHTLTDLPSAMDFWQDFLVPSWFWREGKEKKFQSVQTVGKTV
jgi:hypothetical protein